MWVEPKYSKTQVDQAGDILARTIRPVPADIEESLRRLTNWRASHSFPLNTFQVQLRRFSKQVCDEPLVAQRLKRTPSVVRKLQRFPRMRLTQMQDVGGCRSVVDAVEEVRALREVYRKSSIRHRLIAEEDYIDSPKVSGYRGVHLVYRYYSDRSRTFNGHRIEIQIRSNLQHAWATAVEAVGVLLHTSLKASEGPEEWLEFFRLSSDLFAEFEDTPRIFPDIDMEDVAENVRAMNTRLHVFEKLSVYRTALREVESNLGRKNRYFLLKLDPEHQLLDVIGYGTGELEQASNDYTKAEESIRDDVYQEVVLVGADSVAELKKTYPNYFLDTEIFEALLRDMVESR